MATLPLWNQSHSEKNTPVTVELQWLEHSWDYENMFEAGVVRANECKSYTPGIRSMWSGI